MKTLTEVCEGVDAKGNRVSAGGGILENVSVVFGGKNNTLLIDPQFRTHALEIHFNCNNARIEIGNNRFRGSIRVGEDCAVYIRDGVTCTNNCYISTAEGCSVTIGKDCMIASGVELRSDQSHPIFDVATGKRTNPTRSIEIGEHVWIGGRVCVLGGTKIGEGSVIGYGSIVSGKFPNNCVIAGVPARIIRRDCAWERPGLQMNKPFYKPFYKPSIQSMHGYQRSPYWHATRESDGVLDSAVEIVRTIGTRRHRPRWSRRLLNAWRCLFP